MTEWYCLTLFGIVMATLTIVFSTCCHCQDDIKSTSAFKSDNDKHLNIRESFQACNPLNLNCMCVSQLDREQWEIMYHLTSNLNLFFSLKVKRFRRLLTCRKSMGHCCCKPPPYVFLGSCTFSKMRVHAQKFL